MSDAKRSVLDELGPRWLIASELTTSTDALASAFGRQAPCLVDLGGGTGEATRAWAFQHPDHDVLAIELHRPGIVRMVRDLEVAGPSNVRVTEADGTAVLAAWDAGGLAGLRALFPDPWPKRRHVGRRLVDVGFVRRAADLLLPGATLHLATDLDDYANQIRSALATEPRLDVHVDEAAAVEADEAPVQVDEAVEADEAAGRARPAGRAASPWCSARPRRPVTAYEQRGLDAGRRITDLIAYRRR